jgi:adenylate cyclase
VTVRLEDLRDCFQGIIPSMIATASAAGEPNVAYLSQVYYVREGWVALSCQFFNKTQQNVRENPYATVVVNHPVTFEAWRLRLRYDHSQTEGPLFDTMATRIQVIASHTGMAGVFKLRSADLYEVVSLEKLASIVPVDPRATPIALPPGPMTELRGLQVVSDRIARACDLEALLHGALEALDETLGFSHAMVLLPETDGELVAIASRGYGDEGIGAEVRPGEGMIGLVAEQRRMIRMAGMGSELRYGRAIRGRVKETGQGAVAPEIPLPGLPDAQAQLALPLIAGGRLVGVLAVESRDPLQFDDWDEAFLTIVANQVAMGIDRMASHEEDEEGPPPAAPGRGHAGPVHRFRYFRNDDCIFVDGEYLVRNVPAKILWKVLTAHARERRTEFTNRELRLDPALRLPDISDNLEARLILLQRRLAERTTFLRIERTGRGRFRLCVGRPVQLQDVSASTGR